jgi:hypothetical protein
VELGRFVGMSDEEIRAAAGKLDPVRKQVVLEELLRPATRTPNKKLVGHTACSRCVFAVYPACCRRIAVHRSAGQYPVMPLSKLRYGCSRP